MSHHQSCYQPLLTNMHAPSLALMLMQIIKIGCCAITSHVITLNPSFHANNPGTILRSAQGAFSGQVTLNVTALKPGWHRIFGIGKQLDARTNVTQVGPCPWNSSALASLLHFLVST